MKEIIISTLPSSYEFSDIEENEIAECFVNHPEIEAMLEENYEIFDIQDTAFEKDDPVCDYIGDCVVGSEFCFELCKTNNKRNFVGNEIEGKSIRCAYRFNGGE